MLKFHLEADMKLTAIFEKVGEWWLGYVEELPGANTQGKTLDEARERAGLSDEKLAKSVLSAAQNGESICVSTDELTTLVARLIHMHYLR